MWELWQDKQRSIAARWIIAVWALTALAAVLLLTPIEWARYYLPAIPAAILLASLGIGWVIRQLRMAR
jgi:hypothetical protein